MKVVIRMQKNKIHLIMPMGGAGSRFQSEGFNMPKPLIEINNKPFFYWATRSIEKFIDIKDLTFVVLKEHVENNNIKEKILEYFPSADIVVLEKQLNGAVLTCNEGLINISDDMPVVFSDCDQLFICNEFYNYCNGGNFEELDGILLNFKASEPKYSFLELNNEYVSRTIEKEAISDMAICGCYYFKNKSIFQKNLKKYLENCNYQEYFVSGLYNVMIDNNCKIKTFGVDIHLPFGVPEEYEFAKNSSSFEELL